MCEGVYCTVAVLHSNNQTALVFGPFNIGGNNSENN